ncbi:hypothetical protein ABW19_dt0208758 [Dactylella cylindrospora]|nr:hypothetical protein ABW19_dt0208758 [Dactylella cylindrospora]
MSPRSNPRRSSRNTPAIYPKHEENSLPKDSQENRVLLSSTPLTRSRTRIIQNSINYPQSTPKQHSRNQPANSLSKFTMSLRRGNKQKSSNDSESQNQPSSINNQQQSNYLNSKILNPKRSIERLASAFPSKFGNPITSKVEQHQQNPFVADKSPSQPPNPSSSSSKRIPSKQPRRASVCSIDEISTKMKSDTDPGEISSSQQHQPVYNVSDSESDTPSRPTVNRTKKTYKRTIKSHPSISGSVLGVTSGNAGGPTKATDVDDCLPSPRKVLQNNNVIQESAQGGTMESRSKGTRAAEPIDLTSDDDESTVMDPVEFGEKDNAASGVEDDVAADPTGPTKELESTLLQHNEDRVLSQDDENDISTQSGRLSQEQVNYLRDKYDEETRELVNEAKGEAINPDILIPGEVAAPTVSETDNISQPLASTKIASPPPEEVQTTGNTKSLTTNVVEDNIATSSQDIPERGHASGSVAPNPHPNKEKKASKPPAQTIEILQSIPSALWNQINLDECISGEGIGIDLTNPPPIIQPPEPKEPQTTRDKSRVLSRTAFTSSKSFSKKPWDLSKERLDNIRGVAKPSDGLANPKTQKSIPFGYDEILKADILDLKALPPVTHNGRLPRANGRPKRTTAKKGVAREGQSRDQKVCANRIQDTIDELKTLGIDEVDEDEFFITALNTQDKIAGIAKPGTIAKGTNKWSVGIAGTTGGQDGFHDDRLPSAGLFDWSSLMDSFWNYAGVNLEEEAAFTDLQNIKGKEMGRGGLPFKPLDVDLKFNNGPGAVNSWLNRVEDIGEPESMGVEDLDAEFELFYSKSITFGKDKDADAAFQAPDLDKNMEEACFRSGQVTPPNRLIIPGQAASMTSPLTAYSSISTPTDLLTPLSENGRTFDFEVEDGVTNDAAVEETSSGDSGVLISFDDFANSSETQDQSVTAQAVPQPPATTARRETRSMAKKALTTQLDNSSDNLLPHHPVPKSEMPPKSKTKLPARASAGSKGGQTVSNVSTTRRQSAPSARTTQFQQTTHFTRQRTRSQNLKGSQSDLDGISTISVPSTSKPSTRGTKRKISGSVILDEESIGTGAVGSGTSSGASTPQSVSSAGRRSTRSSRRSSGMGTNNSFTSRRFDIRESQGEGEGEGAGEDDVDLV